MVIDDIVAWDNQFTKPVHVSMNMNSRRPFTIWRDLRCTRSQNFENNICSLQQSLLGFALLSYRVCSFLQYFPQPLKCSTFFCLRSFLTPLVMPKFHEVLCDCIHAYNAAQI